MSSTTSPPSASEGASTLPIAPMNDQQQQHEQTNKQKQDLQSHAKKFIAQEKFNRTLNIPATDTHGPLIVTYAVGGRDSDQVPTLLFIGGLYGGRLMAAILDELAAAFDIRLVVVDRPGMGGSTQVEPSVRLPVWLETVPILMRHLNTPHLSLAAHSCGVIYALNTIYSQPWVLSPKNRKLYLFAPWVRPEHSGVAMLSAASYLPSSLVGSFDAIPRFFSNNILPAVQFSGMVSGMVSSGSRKGKEDGGEQQQEEEEDRKSISADGGQESTTTINSTKPPSPAEFSARCSEMQRVLFQGNTEGANHEALLVLHKKPMDDWLACDDYATYPHELEDKIRDFISTSSPPQDSGVDDDTPLHIRSFWAESDNLIGKKGGQYFDGCFAQFYSPASSSSATTTTSAAQKTGGERCLSYESETIPGTDHNTVFFPQYPGFGEVLRDISAGLAKGGS